MSRLQTRPNTRRSARALAAMLAFGLSTAPLFAAPPPAPAPAAPTDPASPRAALERVRVCWDAADLACVARELEAARAGLDAPSGPGALTPSERHEVLRLSAELALSRDEREAARTACVELLTIDPRFGGEAWPEPWRMILEEARRLAPDRLPPRVTMTPPASARPGEAVALTALVSDPSGVGRCELVLASTAAEVRLPMSTRDGEAWAVEVSAAHVRSPALVFRVEAWDRAGNGPGRFPEQGAYSLEVAAPRLPMTPEPALTERWWFWTAVGLVVAGGVTALVLALDEAPAASPDRSGDLTVNLDLPLSAPRAGAP